MPTLIEQGAARSHRKSRLGHKLQIITSLIVLGIFPFSIAPSWSQSVGEKTGVNQLLDRAPTGTDVLVELQQFNLFQQSVTSSADKRGDGAVKKFAVSQSNAAEKRDKALVALTGMAGLKIDYPEDPSVTRANALGGLDGSVADVYVHGFYKAQIKEHTTAISLLKRYLSKPDNDAIKLFAEKEIPVFVAGLKGAEFADAEFFNRTGK